MARGAFQPYLPAPQSPADLPWTASRCSRVLRQLTSFLSKLEKWHKEFTEERDACFHNAIDCSISNEQELDQHEHQGWLAQTNAAARKKNCRSYSGRRALKIPQTPVSRPKNRRASIGTPSLDIDPTPGSTRHTTFIAPNSEVPHLILEHKDGDNYASRAGKTEQFLSYEGQFEKDQDKEQYRNAWMAISNFLSATSASIKSDNAPRNILAEPGVKSLRLLCQKSVAQSMFYQQRENDSICNGHDGRVHVSAELLEDLENHFGDPVHGWRPLGTITRAYGMNLICEAVRKGHLRLNIARELAATFFCSPMLADAGEAITETVIRVQKSLALIGKKGLLSHDAVPGLHADKDYYRLSWWLRMIELAVNEEDALLILCTGTGLEYFGLALSNLHTGARLGAVALVGTIIRRLLGLSTIGDSNQVTGFPSVNSGRGSLPTSEVGAIFRTYLAKMTAAEIVLQLRCKRCFEWAKGSTVCSEHGCSLLDSISIAIVQHCEADGLEESSGLNVEGALLVLFARRLLASANPALFEPTSHRNTFQNLILRSRSRGSLVAMLANFVILVVKVCGQNGRKKSFDVLRRLTESLSSFESDNSPYFSTQVAREAAMSFVQLYPKVPHIAWANCIQARLTMLLRQECRVSLMPSPNQYQSYKWDACVEEWVQKTPASTAFKECRVIANGLCAGTAGQASAVGAMSQTLATVQEILVPTTIPLPSSPTSGSSTRLAKRPLQMKRKSLTKDFAVAWDGDFTYKKRCPVGLRAESMALQPFRDVSPNISVANTARAKAAQTTPDTTESDDELSLVAGHSVWGMHD